MLRLLCGALRRPKQKYRSDAGECRFNKFSNAEASDGKKCFFPALSPILCKISEDILGKESLALARNSLTLPRHNPQNCKHKIISRLVVKYHDMEAKLEHIPNISPSMLETRRARKLRNPNRFKYIYRAGFFSLLFAVASMQKWNWIERASRVWLGVRANGF